MNKLIYIVIILSISSPLLSFMVYAQTQEQEDIIIPEIIDNRKEYVYCPIDLEALDKSISYEINGCPTIRVYVENYDRLTTLQKADIDTKLKANGFTSKEDFKIDEYTGRILSDANESK